MKQLTWIDLHVCSNWNCIKGGCLLRCFCYLVWSLFFFIFVILYDWFIAATELTGLRMHVNALPLMLMHGIISRWQEWKEWSWLIMFINGWWLNQLSRWIDLYSMWHTTPYLVKVNGSWIFILSIVFTWFGFDLWRWQSNSWSHAQAQSGSPLIYFMISIFSTRGHFLSKNHVPHACQQECNKCCTIACHILPPFLSIPFGVIGALVHHQ